MHNVSISVGPHSTVMACRRHIATFHPHEPPTIGLIRSEGIPPAQVVCFFVPGLPFGISSDKVVVGILAVLIVVSILLVCHHTAVPATL